VFFAWLAYRSVNPALANRQVLDLFVQRTYGVMSNDVLIAIPLFLFMGYLVERAQLIDKLFKSLHLALARVPGALAVATIVTCAIFATATGIVGAVVTLMGLLAFPAMLKAGYNVKVSAGAITAGGCLGILIPPSVLLIVYGAVAGVSVVQLYAGAFLPGFMLAGLYIGYVIVLAKLRPELMPPLPASERRVELPSYAQALRQYGSNALAGLSRAFTGRAAPGVGKRTVLAQLVVTLSPALFILAILGATYHSATSPEAKTDTAGLIEAGGAIAADASESEQSSGLIGAPEAEEENKAQELAPPPQAEEKKPAAEAKPVSAPAQKVPAPLWFWIVLAIGVATIALIYWLWSWERLEVYKMLLISFFPLAILILMVLGSIVFGLATPSEAAAVGGFGGFILAAAYRYTAHVRAPAEQRAGQGKAILATVKDLGAVHDARAVHHLHPRLAARMDRDHHHLHADLPAPAAALQYRPAVLRAAGGSQPADRLPFAAGGDGRLLPQRRVAAARDAESDFRRHDALHGNPAGRARAAVCVPADRAVAAANAVCPMSSRRS
jgi:TRAP-type mannitol/chloroaromatic compound transport system permease large subunit